MERYALIDIADMATILEGAESVIVITEKEGEVILNYSHDLNQMEVLDLLALVMYMTSSRLKSRKRTQIG